MFRFADKSTMSCAAGEPILFELQDCDFAGVVRPLKSGGRSFAFSIFDGVGKSLVYQQSEVITDTTGDFARWVLDGTVSDTLRATPGLTFEVAERLDNGRDQMMIGQLTITSSAPSVTDLDGAPRAKYVQRIKRLFDPVAHGPEAIYQINWEAFYASGLAPTPYDLQLDFSDPANSGLVAVLFGAAPTNTSSASASFSDPSNSMYLALGL